MPTPNIHPKATVEAQPTESLVEQLQIAQATLHSFGVREGDLKPLEDAAIERKYWASSENKKRFQQTQQALTNACGVPAYVRETSGKSNNCALFAIGFDEKNPDLANQFRLTAIYPAHQKIDSYNPEDSSALKKAYEEKLKKLQQESNANLSKASEINANILKLKEEYAKAQRALKEFVDNIKNARTPGVNHQEEDRYLDAADLKIISIIYNHEIVGIDQRTGLYERYSPTIFEDETFKDKDLEKAIFQEMGITQQTPPAEIILPASGPIYINNASVVVKGEASGVHFEGFTNDGYTAVGKIFETDQQANDQYGEGLEIKNTAVDTAAEKLKASIKATDSSDEAKAKELAQKKAVEEYKMILDKMFETNADVVASKNIATATAAPTVKAASLGKVSVERPERNISEADYARKTAQVLTAEDKYQRNVCRQNIATLLRLCLQGTDLHRERFVEEVSTNDHDRNQVVSLSGENGTTLRQFTDDSKINYEPFQSAPTYYINYKGYDFGFSSIFPKNGTGADTDLPKDVIIALLEAELAEYRKLKKSGPSNLVDDIQNVIHMLKFGELDLNTYDIGMSDEAFEKFIKTLPENKKRAYQMARDICTSADVNRLALAHEIDRRSSAGPKQTGIRQFYAAAENAKHEKDFQRAQKEATAKGSIGPTPKTTSTYDVANSIPVVPTVIAKEYTVAGSGAQKTKIRHYDLSSLKNSEIIKYANEKEITSVGGQIYCVKAERAGASIKLSLYAKGGSPDRTQSFDAVLGVAESKKQVAKLLDQIYKEARPAAAASGAAAPVPAVEIVEKATRARFSKGS